MARRDRTLPYQARTVRALPPRSPRHPQARLRPRHQWACLHWHIADLAISRSRAISASVAATQTLQFNRYEEAKVKHVLYWCTIGGTSVASPLIASTFALAGGANKVEYPAKTLYENEVKSPGSLHDVATGSNGECTKPFSETGLSGCTTAYGPSTCLSSTRVQPASPTRATASPIRPSETTIGLCQRRPMSLSPGLGGCCC
jgi:hypothetical protein